MRFRRYLPAFAHVLITERDEYICQSIMQTIRIAFSPKLLRNSYLYGKAQYEYKPHGNVLVVCGMGHLSGKFVAILLLITIMR